MYTLMPKALPEKAYHFFKQKVRSATDKPKEEQVARPAFFLALRNFAMSNKLNVGSDENNTQMVAQSAAMENLICAFCGKGNHPIEACCHPDAPLGSCLDGPTKHKVINNQHALVKALKDGKTAKDWKDYVNTNSDRRPSKEGRQIQAQAQEPRQEGKGRQVREEVQGASLEDRATGADAHRPPRTLGERCRYATSSDQAPPSTAPTFGASSVCIHRAAARGVSLRGTDSPTGD
jgi:hypothetical protein